MGRKIWFSLMVIVNIIGIMAGAYNMVNGNLPLGIALLSINVFCGGFFAIKLLEEVL